VTTSPAAVPRRTVRQSIDLLRSHQKPPRGVSVYTRYVNRPWGRALAAVLDRIGLTPNLVTVLSGICSLSAVAMIAIVRPSPGIGLVVAFLLALGFALDSADGQLARLQGTGGRSGEFLDHMLDCLVKLTLHLAVLIAWVSLEVPRRWLLIPIGFQIAAVLLFFGGTLVAVLYTRPAEQAAAPHPVRSWLLLPVDHGAVCWAFVLWGFLPAFAVVYTALFVAHVVMLLALSVVWFRELSS
jgi:phosphatidylglycerophosphate synthase